MTDTTEASRKKQEAEFRKEQRRWVIFSDHPKGGYWKSYALDESEHGSWNGYNNWYCRCPPCAEANRIKRVEFVKERDAESSDASDLGESSVQALSNQVVLGIPNGPEDDD